MSWVSDGSADAGSTKNLIRRAATWPERVHYDKKEGLRTMREKVSGWRVGYGREEVQTLAPGLATALLGNGNQGGNQLFVAAKKVFHALAVAGEGIGAVELVNGVIESAMGLT